MKAFATALLAILLLALLLWRPWEEPQPGATPAGPPPPALSAPPSLPQGGLVIEPEPAPAVTPPAEPKGLSPQDEEIRLFAASWLHKPAHLADAAVAGGGDAEAALEGAGEMEGAIEAAETGGFFDRGLRSGQQAGDC
jgi:hypothetical protein